MTVSEEEKSYLNNYSSVFPGASSKLPFVFYCTELDNIPVSKTVPWVRKCHTLIGLDLVS